MEKNNVKQNGKKDYKKSPYVALVYIVVLIFSISICYKFFYSEIQFEFKFNDLLTLVVSLFAIGMSMAFYFKTTETSNRFYDNTNRFTTDIRTTLSGIESGFREMLQNIQMGNTAIESKIDNMYFITEKVKKGVVVIDEVELEKEKIIKDFAAKNNAKTEEINKLLFQLEEKDAKIFKQQQNIANLMVEIEKSNGKTNSNIVQITKLSELKNAPYPNNIEVGYSTQGKFYNAPKVGERFWVGSFRTSTVQEIIDENTFKTKNSIYKWSFCE